jgi:hypothetical protein
MTVTNSHRVENQSDSQLKASAEPTSGDSPITSAHSNGPTPQSHEQDEKSNECNVQNAEETTTKRQCWTGFMDIIFWTPPRCRWDAENPCKFGLPLNILFAFSGTFTVWKAQKIRDPDFQY